VPLAAVAAVVAGTSSSSRVAAAGSGQVRTWRRKMSCLTRSGRAWRHSSEQGDWMSPVSADAIVIPGVCCCVERLRCGRGWRPSSEQGDFYAALSARPQLLATTPAILSLCWEVRARLEAPKRAA
jgi:hypothetical protein